jgi:hypothetical protein
MKSRKVFEEKIWREKIGGLITLIIFIYICVGVTLREMKAYRG